MSSEPLAMHYVCTQAEAKDLIANHSRFWVSNCGCREGKGGCEKSRMDICLYFIEETDPSGSDYKEISRAEVDEILKLAQEKHLVIRPFRDTKTFTETEGICFCCDCCCSYFLSGNEKCDQGKYIEETEIDQCLHCGACVDICYFQARELEGEELVIDRDKCFGCGLCPDVCPVNCISMVQKS